MSHFLKTKQYLHTFLLRILYLLRQTYLFSSFLLLFTFYFYICHCLMQTWKFIHSRNWFKSFTFLVALRIFFLRPKHHKVFKILLNVLTYLLKVSFLILKINAKFVKKIFNRKVIIKTNRTWIELKIDTETSEKLSKINKLLFKNMNHFLIDIN